MKSASPHLRRRLRLAVGVIISGVCLYLALRNVDLTSTWSSITQADLTWLLVALAVIVVNNLAKAARWKVLLGAQGEQVHFIKALVSHLAGQTLNSLFPVRVGDLSRAYVIGGLGPGRAYVFGTVMLEKLPDIIALTALFLVLLAVIPLPEWVGGAGYALIIIAILTFFIVMLVMSRRDQVLHLLGRCASWLPSRWQGPIRDGLQAGFASLDVFNNPSQLIKISAWTGLIWATALGVNYILFQALSMVVPLTGALLLLLALTIGITVPSVPGRIGLFEFICILCLAVFGVGQSEALAYGILLHAVTFLPVAIFGLIFISVLGVGQTVVGEPSGIIKTSKGDPS
jgi:uncharacterized protein (TIRG00374 family)